MNWDDLRIFLSVARHRSLTGAAQSLRLDPATLGRRIARLEAALGAVLFRRSPQGYELTLEGERLQRTAQTMEEAAGQAADASRASDELGGVLRIGAPDGCANYLLPKVLCDISAEHPALEAQILALPRLVNLSQREADIAIAVSRPTAGRLTVQKIADYHLSLAADAHYLAKASPIRDIADLQRHPIVGYIPDMIFDKELDYLSTVGIERPRLASNSVAVQFQLLKAQGGVGFVHDFALAEAPELRPVLPGLVRLKRSFWLVRHVDERSVPRVSKLSDAVLEGLRRVLAERERSLDRIGREPAG